MTSLRVIILITVRATPVNWPAKGKAELDISRNEKKEQKERKIREGKKSRDSVVGESDQRGKWQRRREERRG